MESILIGNKNIVSGTPPYIIAEIGSNHNGDMQLCKKLIDAAADAGAHAVKFQSWSDKSLIAKEEYERNTEYSDKKKHFGTLLEMVQAYQFTKEQHREAHALCRARGIDFCSTPFSATEVDLLEELDVPFYKVASMDIVYEQLLQYIARKNKPVVISTGMATLSEIEQAVNIVRAEGNDKIVLLHCISIYPPEYSNINLNNIVMLQQAFNLPVGYSDHSLGTAIPLAATALGACIIEKHFTLDKEMEGWDHAISANPQELVTIVEGSKNIAKALGSFARAVTKEEIQKRNSFRRSLVTLKDLDKGHAIAAEDLTAKRPGTGISPNELQYVVGRILKNSISEDKVLSWDDLM